MAHILTTEEKATQRTPGQWSKTYLAIPEYHTIYTARLASLPATNDLVAQIAINTESGTRANVLADMTLYIGTTLGAYDLGMCRIRKTPIDGFFYIGEASDVVWQVGAYLTVVDDYSLWQKSLRMVSNEAFMDWDVDYSNQHTLFDPVPAMGSHRVAKLSGLSVNVQLGPSADVPAWVIGSTISARLWSVTGGTLDDATATNPVATFDAPGTYLVYCLFTAANGKTYTGVRYVIIWDDDHPLITHFLLGNGRGSFESGGYSYDVTLETGFDVSTLRKRSLVILCTEDFADSQPVTMPGQLTGAENIVCVGWISDINTERNSEFGQISFTVQSAEFWLKQIRDYPSGLKLKAGIPVAWTDMSAMTVDRAVWHFLHWRSTATRVMDIQLTGDTRLATQFKTTRSNLWERLVTVAMPTIFARPHVDAIGRLFVYIEPQMVPEADRTSIPVVMTILDTDIEGGIQWVRRDVSPLSMLFFSGIAVNATGGASSFFSMSPGHSYRQHGEEESQDNYLVASQANSNQLCGLYYGRRNNPLDNLEINFIHSMRVLGISPRQYFYYDLSAADDPRGIGFAGNLIPRDVQFAQDPETGFIAFTVVFEPESFDGPVINGDVPTMERIDFSSPNYYSLPSLPALPALFLDPTKEPNNQPVKVVVATNNYGVFYSENFNEDDPAKVAWIEMNSGLAGFDISQIAQLVVTPSGKLYILTNGDNYSGYQKVFVTDGLGGAWREIFNAANFPSPTIYQCINGIGVNPLQNDQIAIFGGNPWNPLGGGNEGAYYFSFVNNGVVTIGPPLLGSWDWLDPRVCLASVIYANNGWNVSSNRGVFADPTLWRISPTGELLTFASLPGNSPLWHGGCSAGTQDLTYTWDGNVLCKVTVNGTIIEGQSITPPDAQQGVAFSPTGTHGMAADGVTPMKTTDGGTTWVAVSATTPVGADVWENCKDNFRWIRGGGSVLALTMDQGDTWVDKIGNLYQMFPLVDVTHIRFIE